MTTRMIAAKRIRMFEFKEVKYAFDFADSCRKMHVIIRGDNGRFWVVSLANGVHLLLNGYKSAKRPERTFASQFSRSITR